MVIRADFLQVDMSIEIIKAKSGEYEFVYQIPAFRKSSFIKKFLCQIVKTPFRIFAISIGI